MTGISGSKNSHFGRRNRLNHLISLGLRRALKKETAIATAPITSHDLIRLNPRKLTRWQKYQQFTNIVASDRFFAINR